jgi:hypothetical protein
MNMPEFTRWDAERYQELNEFFRLKIKTMLESDPHLRDLLSQNKSLQLAEITERMSIRDQDQWQEFLYLDQLKFEQDLQNHLEGRGTPYNTRTGFGRSHHPENDESPTW